MTMLSRDLSVHDVPLWALRYKLTPQQAVFVESYRQDFDPIKALRTAGFSGRDEKALAAKLLHQRKIQAALKHRNEDLRARAEEMRESALDWARAILEADLSEIYDQSNQLKPVKEWPAVWRMGVVKSMKVYSDARGSISTVVQLKMQDRLRFLELMMRYLGMLGPRVKRNEDKKFFTKARAAQLQADRVTPKAF